jgi:FMN phosphatase YigB (HAD superfamily)
MSAPTSIPYARVATLFLDVGNTLIEQDFSWIARELAAHGVACSAADLCAADAALRPRMGLIAREIGAVRGYAEARASYLAGLFDLLPHASRLDAESSKRIARELVPVLYPGGRGQRLWSRVMRGVPEALQRFAQLGLRMVVVSNADGSVEQQLIEHGLRAHFDVVIDSHVVGAVKPDPEIFEIALARSGAERPRTLHVGDSYDADVLGARGAGVHGLLLDPDGRWGTRDCDVLPDLLALADRLERAQAP